MPQDRLQLHKPANDGDWTDEWRDWTAAAADRRAGRRPALPLTTGAGRSTATSSCREASVPESSPKSRRVRTGAPNATATPMRQGERGMGPVDRRIWPSNLPRSHVRTRLHRMDTDPERLEALTEHYHGDAAARELHSATAWTSSRRTFSARRSRCSRRYQAADMCGRESEQFERHVGNLVRASTEQSRLADGATPVRLRLQRAACSARPARSPPRRRPVRLDHAEAAETVAGLIGAIEHARSEVERPWALTRAGDQVSQAVKVSQALFGARRSDRIDPQPDPRHCRPALPPRLERHHRSGARGDAGRGSRSSPRK